MLGRSAAFRVGSPLILPSHRYLPSPARGRVGHIDSGPNLPTADARETLDVGRHCLRRRDFKGDTQRLNSMCDLAAAAAHNKRRRPPTALVVTRRCAHSRTTPSLRSMVGVD
eukprot:361616-Chlamydomonas_euryale.AAC.12